MFIKPQNPALIGTPAWMPTRCTLDRGADVGAGRRAAVVKATTGRCTRDPSLDVIALVGPQVKHVISFSQLGTVRSRLGPWCVCGAT